MQKMTAIELDRRYALVKPEEAKKPILVQLRDRDGKLIGIVQNNHAISAPDKIDVSKDEILTVFLSKRPLHGTAYGVKVEPLYQTKRIEKWGLMHLYRELTDAELDVIQRGLALTYNSLIRRFNLRALLPIIIEIRQRSGKHDGSWHTPKGETTGIMRLTPKSFIELKPVGVQELVSHELGHPLWSHWMNKKLQADWVRLYHSALALTEISMSDMTGMRRDFVNSGMSTAGYRKALTEENQVIFDACVHWIANAHYVTSKYLDLLVMDGDNLKEYWPRTQLHLSDLHDLVTEYAKKDPCELWCESLAFRSIDKPMPESVTALIKKTLKQVTLQKDTKDE